MPPIAQDQFKNPASYICLADITGIDHGGLPDVLILSGF
jgi:hypothetical protein